ncbi:MAG: hypothetical protein U1E23_14485 [Reyranellaceae bacterium]
MSRWEPARPPWWSLPLVFALSLALLCGLIAGLHNVHILTSNGLYKSLEAAPWIADPATARLDPSNYLYFPLQGVLVRLLDALGIDRGVPWRQFAWVNAAWASLAVAIVYGFLWRLTGDGRAAAAGALFHLGCGFVLLLGVINEDIMAGYTLVLGAMALAGLWFDRPTAPRVVAVAVLFTLGWLIEWRLIFPTLPALLLALLLSPGSLRRRAALMSLLLVALVATAGLVQQLWEGHPGAVGLHDLLWTGKGVNTGWAGLGWDKAWMMLSGVGNYFLLVGGWVDPLSARRAAAPLVLSVVVQGVLLLSAIVLLWPRRGEPRLRAVAAVFLGTLGAGEVFNLYSQPQDPQMQVNVLPALAVAWALLVAEARRRGRGLGLLLLALSVVPLAWNGAALARFRGGDRAALAALAALEQRLPPESTVFVYWGFEPIVTWQYALWSQHWDWDGKVEIAPAPSAAPRFKWIALDAGAIRHPDWTAAHNAEVLQRDIDRALDRGYRVVISDVWTWSREELARQLGALSAAGRADAIYAMLHERYEASPVLADGFAGNYYELRRR